MQASRKDEKKEQIPSERQDAVACALLQLHCPMELISSLKFEEPWQSCPTPSLSLSIERGREKPLLS